MQRSSRRRRQESLHLNCVSTSLKSCSFWKCRTGVHVHADTSTMQKKKKGQNPNLFKAGCSPLGKKDGENSDAVMIKQLNSPVTMSPAGAGSGKGEGPRETAGRSNLPTQASGRIRERRKPWRSGSKEKY